MNLYLARLLIVILIVMVISIIVYVVNYLLNGSGGLKCDTETDKDLCQGAGKICKTNNDTTEESCGRCSYKEGRDPSNFTGKTDLKPVEREMIALEKAIPNARQKEICKDSNGIWTSNMSSCFWISPYPEDATDVTQKCIYDLNKCDEIDCEDFYPTNLFGDCCGQTDNWEKFMDLRTLKESNEDAKNTPIHKIENEYTLRKASAEEYSRRTEIDQGLYA